MEDRAKHDARVYRGRNYGIVPQQTMKELSCTGSGELCKLT